MHTTYHTKKWLIRKWLGKWEKHSQQCKNIYKFLWHSSITYKTLFKKEGEEGKRICGGTVAGLGLGRSSESSWGKF